MRALLALMILTSFVCLHAEGARAASSEPTLTIKADGETRTLTRSELLKRPDVERVTIKDDPAYPGQTMTYKAVPAHALFSGLKIAADAVIQFQCSDGFSAPLGRDRLLNGAADKSIAYVAIEPADAPWPALKPGSPSAGPFYLIWPKPDLSFISREEWPFQLAAFEVKGSLAKIYPKILPDPTLSPDAPARRGFEAFTRNCFACHTLNESGAAAIGPDLNVPMSPTEYLTKKALRMIIRDPQSVRRFAKSKMTGFPPSVLAERDLDDLIAYLEHMAKRRAAP